MSRALTSIEDIEGLLRACSRDFTSSEMTAIGQSVSATVVRRTQSGKGADSAFKAYSPASVKQRAKKGYQTAYVDLTQRHNMLGNLGVLTGVTNHCQVGFSSTTEAAKAGWNERLRPFIELSDTEVSTLICESLEQHLVDSFTNY
jgi:hypothetical protein